MIPVSIIAVPLTPSGWSLGRRWFDWASRLLGAEKAEGLEGLQPVNQETTAGIIAAQVRERITDGTFPLGSQLREAQLAARLKVSRGPVREALQRLVQEGLLRSERNHGVFVISLGEDDIADIYLARGAIEQTATLTLMRRKDTEAFNRLQYLVDRMSVIAEEGRWKELADLDLQFHESLIDASNSKRLQRMFSTLLAETRMCLAALESAYPVREMLVDEHRKLLDAMRTGSEQEVLELVHSHLEDAVNDLTGKNQPSPES
jgi:DNA-binding GntR family transcriptional regulator